MSDASGEETRDPGREEAQAKGQDSEYAEGADRRARMYRREALDYHVGAQHDAQLIELSPNWTRRAYWVTLIICTVAVFFVVVAEVNEYAAGMAIVRSEGRTYVTAHTAGTVESVEVRPGDRIQEGAVLLRLYAKGEAAEFQRIEREFELQLVKLLRNLDDQAARGALTTLRAQRERARTLVEERSIRATRAGIVSDVRVRPGQQLTPGDFVASLAEEDAGARVVAMLPGQYRPLLRPGMAMRLEIEGFPYAYVTVTLDRVSDEVVSPVEVRRYLAQPIADLFDSQGPVVFVEARLRERSFVVSGRSLNFHDGMLARAEVAVRSESVLLTLIPGLRSLQGDHVEGR